MAARLPFELLCEIAGHLQQAGASLVACTAVCHRWQTAFESIIYSKLKLYSEGGFDGRGICLKKFQGITSGPRIGRRAWVRELQYFIVVPFDLPDWWSRQADGYTTDNSVRQANDTAFQSAVINLFDTLGSWDKSHRLSIIVALQGRKQRYEPCTELSDELLWIEGEPNRAVPLYRARFHGNGASMLRDVSCIDKLSLPYAHGIWAEAVMQIVRHCPELTELYIDLDKWIRRDHREYIKQRRQGMRLSYEAFLFSKATTAYSQLSQTQADSHVVVTERLKDIPPSLRVFHFHNEYDWDWQDVVPTWSVLSSSVDILSIRIRELSLSLRELQLYEVSVSLDFLWPLDEKDRSLPANTFLHWPNLETMSLSFNPFLPSGEPIVPVTPDGKAMDSDNRGDVEQPILKQEPFHRLFISLGYAARRMLRVRSITFTLNHAETFYFGFFTRWGPISVEWDIDGCGLYMPDDRVAAAWGFQLDHHQLTGLHYEAFLSHWPPIEG